MTTWEGGTKGSQFTRKFVVKEMDGNIPVSYTHLTGLGVRVMKLSDEDRVVTFTRTEHDETADIEEVEQASDEEIAAAEACLLYTSGRTVGSSSLSS